MDGKSTLGVKENVGGLLCYLGIFVTGLVFFLLEKESKFVKFHATQSLLTFGALFIINIILSILIDFFRQFKLEYIFNVLSGLVTILILIIWLVGMIFAYQGKLFKLPIVGKYAAKIAEKQ
jgi:uncharacterized membrane protein